MGMKDQHACLLSALRNKIKGIPQASVIQHQIYGHHSGKDKK
jgi:hypothetical protein